MVAVVGLFVLVEVVEVGGCSYGERVPIESKGATVVIGGCVVCVASCLLFAVCCLLFVVLLKTFKKKITGCE